MRVSEGSSLCPPWCAVSGKGWSLRLPAMYSLNASSGTMKLTIDYNITTDPNIDQVLTLRESQAESQLPSSVRDYGKKVQKSDLQADTVGIGSYRILYGMSRVKRAISRGEKSIDKPLLRTIPIKRRRASLACRTVRSVRIAKSIRLQILSSTA